jgi:hypothetical protein
MPLWLFLMREKGKSLKQKTKKGTKTLIYQYSTGSKAKNMIILI